MMVVGVQAVGSKGVTAVQGSVVDTRDPRETAGTATDGDADARRAAGGAARGGIPQPVVFPRKGVPVDPRPVAMRQKQAVTRYRRDGGDRNDAA